MLNFKIKKQFFLNCLSLVQGASEKKGSMPIISNLLIESVGSRNIKVSATDLEISIIAHCEAEIITEGKTTVNSKKIYSIIKEFPDGKDKDKNEQLINFSENENGVVTVSYKKAVFKLTTVPASDFPTIVDFKSEDSFNIDLKTLKSLIGKVIFSTALNEDAKRNLTGIYFIIAESSGKDFLKLVATDGHRLSLATSEILYGGNKKSDGIYELFKKGVIIPKKILSEVLKLDKDGTIKILINLNNVIFELEREITDKPAENLLNINTKLISRLIEGKFPDYETVLPKEGYKISVVNTKKFFNSIKMVSLLAEEKSYSIELSFNENNLLVKTVNANIGEASDEIDIIYKGEPISIKLNSRYIMDFISNISEENINVKFNTIYTPFVIEPNTDKPAGQESGENEIPGAVKFIGVFMPMRY